MAVYPQLYIIINCTIMNTKVKEPVSKIMTTNVITLDVNNDLSDACRLFLNHKIRHLPIVKNHKMVGILSYNDVLRISFGEAYDDKSAIDNTIYKLISIKQLMVEDPIRVCPDDSIRKFIKVLINNKFHAVPVVENRKLVGMVSTTDLLKYLMA